jgi:mannitol operon transcriptional antiterminator
MKSIGLSEEQVEVVLVMLARRQEQPEVIHQLGKISAALIADDDFVQALKEAEKETIQEKMLNILLSLERES